MPRPNKPWFWEARGEWYVKIDGKRRRLGSDKEEAHRHFHELMAQPKKQVVRSDSVLVIFDLFLDAEAPGREHIRLVSETS